MENGEQDDIQPGDEAAVRHPAEGASKVWERWSDWNELVSCLQQELVLSQEMLERTANSRGAQSASGDDVAAMHTIAGRCGEGGDMAGGDMADVIKKLRNYLEELPAKTHGDGTASSMPSLIQCSYDSSRLRRLPPPEPAEAVP